MEKHRLAEPKIEVQVLSGAILSAYLLYKQVKYFSLFFRIII